MNIAILGSTGSIGHSTLEVIRQNKKDFSINLLTAKTNHKLLIEQCEEFNPEFVYLEDEQARKIFEGNVLDNLSFSISTGSFLDSLNLKGTVVDAITLKPKPNVRVFLHESNINDSLSFKTTPKYTTKTNAKGDFIISNLNNENYNLFCIVQDQIQIVLNLLRSDSYISGLGLKLKKDLYLNDNVNTNEWDKMIEKNYNDLYNWFRF